MNKRYTLALLSAAMIGGLNAQQMAPHRTQHALIEGDAQQAGVQAKRPGTQKAATVALGNAANMYTILLSGQNQVSYDPGTNAVVFVHRQLASEFNNQGGSGTIRFDVSTDGGATFTNGRLLTPGIFNNTAAPVTGARFPNITIWNPAGNTDPANAYAVSSGATLNSVNAGQWGIIQASSAKFDGSNVADDYLDIYGDNTTFHTYGLQTGSDGTLWSLAGRYSTTGDNSDSIDYATFSVLKGVFNTGTNSVDWTATPLPFETFVYTDPDNGTTSQVTSWNIGFAPDGVTGYAVINGVDRNTTPRPAPQPYVFKTTDGGATWNALPVHDFSAEQWVIDNIPGANDTGLPRPYFSDMDITVDADGKLHMISEVLSASLGNSSDSAGYVFVDLITQFIVYASTTDGVTWELAKLSDIFGEDYEWPATAPPGPLQSNRPQATRTADGTKVFFSWNSSGPNETENILPDIYCAGRNVTTGQWTATKNLTFNTSAEGAAWFHTVAPISISNGADLDTELPIVYAEPGANDTDPCGFWYLKGVGFNDNEFAFGIGMSENPLDDRVAVFPNPTEGAVELLFNGLGQVDLTVVDVTGRLVLSERTGRMQHTIDLGAEPAGVYLLTVRTAAGVTSRRVVRQ